MSASKSKKNQADGKKPFMCGVCEGKHVYDVKGSMTGLMSDNSN